MPSKWAPAGRQEVRKERAEAERRRERSHQIAEHEELCKKIYGRTGLDAALDTAQMPLEIMLRRMNGDSSVTDEQFQAAVAAAPYIHPRLQSSEARIHSDNTHHVISDQPMTVEEWVTRFATPAEGETEH